MAFDEGLVERVRGVLDQRPDVSEKRMFGGIAFMVGGHMCVGVTDSRPMKGFLYVAPAGIEREADLERWVEHALRYVTSLPAREPAPKRIAAARTRTPRAQVRRLRTRRR